MIARSIVSWCLRNPVLVAVLALAAAVWGGWALVATPVDAIPDIGEKQVIVLADWPGRSPQDVDRQVTYPLVAALEGTSQVKTIRSMSGLGFSMVFVIFRDDADYYWARSRVLERLSSAQGRLPEGVVPVLGPDATALGQVFWYTLEEIEVTDPDELRKGAPERPPFSLEELRSIQDWHVRYALNAVEGVSEVASIGGHVREYQIDLDPVALRAHGVTLPQVFDAVRRSNLDVGAKVIERSGIEFFLRGTGFLRGVEDLEAIPLRESGGTPLMVRDVGRVTLGPEFRRGALDKEGSEACGGIVLMRFGANPREVIRRVKGEIDRISVGLPRRRLPDGRIFQVAVVPYYDRSTIIQETMDTLKGALTEELLCAGLVVLVFLLHLRASLSILATLPLSMALAYLCMYYLGVDGNIMSLAGLAIAIGDVADMGIIMTENIYRALAVRRGEPLSREGRLRVVEEAAHEVAPAILTAVTNTLLSFIPVFFLEAEEGKLFRPLAYTKTFAIGASVLLALTVVPSLALLTLGEIRWRRRTRWGVALGCGAAACAAFHFVGAWAVGGSGGVSGWPMACAVAVVVAGAVLRMTSEVLRPMDENPLSRAIARAYAPTLRWVLGHKKTFLAVPLLLIPLGLSIWLGFDTIFFPLRWPLARLGWDPGMTPPWVAARHAMPGLGREFMPPLDEGSFLYMPSILPAGSLTQALQAISRQDAAMRQVPEVLDVVGKIGRADSAVDPAPIGMVETIVTLRPESEWRRVPVQRWFSGWPAWAKAPLAAVWPEERAITKDEIRDDLSERTAIPGVLPTWLQPIETRLVMLSTGFRAVMGVKVYGEDLREIERICIEMERVLREVPGAVDVVPDRIVGKPYLEFEIDREAAARYGLGVMEVQEAIENGIGGERLTTTVEGAERYPVRVRYARELRDSPDALEEILLTSMDGTPVPLAAVVRIRYELGPQEIKRENTRRVGYVTLNTRGRDEVSVVEDAERLLQARIQREGPRPGTIYLPPGYDYEWGGRYEAQARATRRFMILIPTVIALMALSLYLGFGRLWIAGIVLFAMAVSVTGGFLMLSIWGVNLSVAVWVGIIALLGVADDDAVVMLTYLEQRFAGRRPGSVAEIRDGVVDAGLKRIRPCLMTTATTVFGLVPVFLTHGRGSDVMQPMAIPSVGGMAIQLIALFLAPCLYCAVLEWRLRRGGAVPSAPGDDGGRRGG